MNLKRTLIWGATAGLVLGSVMFLLFMHLAETDGRGKSVGGWLAPALYLVNWPVLKLFEHTSNFSFLGYAVIVATLLGYWVLICVAVSVVCFLVVRKGRASLARIRAEVPGPNIAAAVVKRVVR